MEAGFWAIEFEGKIEREKEAVMVARRKDGMPRIPSLEEKVADSW